MRNNSRHSVAILLLLSKSDKGIKMIRTSNSAGQISSLDDLLSFCKSLQMII